MGLRRGNLPDSIMRGLGAIAVVLLAGIAAMCVRAAHAAYRELHPPRIVADLAEAHALGELEAIELRTVDGLTLRGWWHPPANGAAVVLAHGDAANRAQLLPEATGLARAGFGVLLLDLRGHGTSEGRTTLGDRERLDVAAAVDHAAGRPGVRAVGVLGFSIGGLAAFGAAASDPRIRAVAALSTCPSLATMLRREHTGLISGAVAVLTVRAHGVALENARPEKEVCAVAPRPVLLVDGERDPEAPPAIGAVLARSACGPVEVWPVRGGGHGDWHGPSGDAARARIVAFFKGALAQP
jgi:dipeptidyl aminopeptidase/acylaminoacyl peptidase